ncbi:hypothetical protein FKW77_002726 [Venturia effusa]|uniref:Uncharacterized protein n=1 Tax=Venturia effusa TaxID=50376 RepID=A0A517LJU6_9PEZI|nr:hypothetical protein FKW77_002726 [Venturia effusa]
MAMASSFEVPPLGEDMKNESIAIENPSNTKLVSQHTSPTTFTLFTKLPTELQTNFIRQHVYSDPPLIKYERLRLSKAKGPQPFCGPNSTNLAIYKIKQLSEHLSQLMNEPAVPTHVFEITPENMINLASWQFPYDTPVIRFQKIAFNIDLAPLRMPILDQLKFSQNFLARFTSAVKIEIYVAERVNNQAASPYGLAFAHILLKGRCGLTYETIRAAGYDFKRAARIITTLQSIHIYHGLSAEIFPDRCQGWDKNLNGMWTLAPLPEKPVAKFKDREWEKFWRREEEKTG